MTTFTQSNRSLTRASHNWTAQRETFQPCKFISSYAVAYALMLTAVIVTIATGATVAEPETQGTTAKSFFLVASRDMPDPVFQQSVILMLPPDQPPLVSGVIINKPTDVTLGKLLSQPLARGSENQRVYFGGPVDLNIPLMVIRTTKPPKAAIRLWRDVYAIADPNSIRDTLKESRGGDDARLFLGRAQWLQEQLRGELLQGAWTVVPLRTDLIFEHDSAKVWPILSKHEHVREIKARGAGRGHTVSCTTFQLVALRLTSASRSCEP